MNEEHASTLTSPSLEALHNAYYTGIYQRVYHLVKHCEDAEDLTQEVFLRALLTLQTTRNLNSWVYRIATNLAVNMLRRRKLITWQSIDAMEWMLEAIEVCDPQTRYNGIAELASVALADLPDHSHTVLVLDAVGYCPAEIAQAQGRKPHALSSFLARARESIQQHYEALEQRGAISMSTRTQPTVERGTVYTLGYAHPAAPGQLERLMRDPLACLVDIRYQPRSRLAHQWNRAAISARYVWERRLGTIHYSNSEQGITLADGHQDAIREAAALLCEGTSLILLCECSEARACHRTLVAKLIQDALPVPKYGEVRQ